jgi:hypothetical protein
MLSSLLRSVRSHRDSCHTKRSSSLKRLSHSQRLLRLETMEDRVLLDASALIAPTPLESATVHVGTEEDAASRVVVFVDVDSTYDPTDEGAGSSWATAFTDLQDAIDLANAYAGDADPTTEISEVWVAEGTYIPTELSDADGNGTVDTDPRSATFSLVDGVAIYGGFAGDETDIASRHGGETILTGDLNGDDSSGGSNAENAYTVVSVKELDHTTILNGFTVTDGNADKGSTAPCGSGGGIHIVEYNPDDGGRLILSELLVAYNSADLPGGGIYVRRGAVTVEDSTIINNTAVLGGGIATSQELLTVINTTIAGNSGRTGGGLCISFGGADITNSVIVGNNASTTGGGIYMYGNGPVTVRSSSIVGNSAETDGGGTYQHPILFQNSIVALNSSPNVDNVCGSLKPGSSNNLFDVDPGFIRSPSYGPDGLFGGGDDDYGDLRLSFLSDAVDQGDASLLPQDVHDLDGDGDETEPLPFDLEGNVRVDGNALDIGAYESEFVYLPKPTVLFVDADSTYDSSEPGAGNSWATAFADLQDALEFAETWNHDADPLMKVKEIWVAEGTHIPTELSDLDGDGAIDTDPRSATFTLVDGVAIYGGFAGDEADVASRHGGETILTGDLNGDDSTGGDNSENAYSVVAVQNLEQTTRLDGFTVTAGHSSDEDAASDSPLGSGGGVYFTDLTPESGELLLANAIIDGNYANQGGGGIYTQGALLVTNSTVRNNEASNGGGIYINSGNLRMTNSLVANNNTSSRGAVYNNGVFHAVNSTIASNESFGIYMTDSTLVRAELFNTIVASNRGVDIWQGDYATLTGFHCLIGNGDWQAGVFTNTHIGTTEDPHEPFADPDSSDFRLLEGSLASDSGATALAVYPDATPITSDLSGDPRIQNASVDMGAFEGAVYIPGQIYVVNSLGLEIAAGDGVLTLPEALAASNRNQTVGDAQAGSPMEQDVIQFAPGLTGTITLDGTELLVTGDLRIEGPGAEILTIDANELSRVFNMKDANLTNWDIPRVETSGLTLTGGLTIHDPADSYSGCGGGIYSSVDLTLREMAIRENLAELRGGGLYSSGALIIHDSVILSNSKNGIYNACGVAYALSLYDSTISNNSSGGILNGVGSNLNIVRSTISHNTGNGGITAEGSAGSVHIVDTMISDNVGVLGGGVNPRRGFDDFTITNSMIIRNHASYGGGGILNDCRITVTNCTITENSAPKGGGIYSYGINSTHLHNTIVTKNSATTSGPDVYGPIIALNSLIGDGTDMSGVTDDVDGNLVGTAVSPIDPLFINSEKGDYRLHPLSPAVDAGDIALLPADEFDLDDDADTTELLPVDLDGIRRVRGDQVDMGSFEFDYSGTMQVRGTPGDDVIHIYPGSPDDPLHRVYVNGFLVYCGPDLTTLFADGLLGDDTLSIHGTSLLETAILSETDVAFSALGSYIIKGEGFENTYVYSNGGGDTAVVHGTSGDDDLYINDGYSYLRGDSRAWLSYLKGFESVTYDANEPGQDRLYLYDGTGDDVLFASETQMTIDYDAGGTPDVDVFANGFNEVNAYAVNGGRDAATLKGSSGDDRFTARDLYGRMQGNGGSYTLYAQGFDVMTGDASGTGGTDVATLFDAEGDDLLEAGESSASLDLDATPGVDDFNLIANGFDQTYTYAIRGGNDTALMTGSDSADRLTSKRTYSTLKRQDGSYFNYAHGFEKTTADVSTGGGADLAFLYDDATDDAFEAGPSQATLDYNANGSPGVDTTAIGFREVYAYAEKGGHDTVVLNGSAEADKYYGLAAYSYLKATDDSYFNYARGFDTVTANASGLGDLAFLYGSDGNDAFNANSSLATFILNPTAGGQVINTAEAFDQVYGYATGGGTDSANLTGAAGPDTLTADADWGILRSTNASDYFNYIRYFDEVFADPGDDELGNDLLDNRGVAYALDATPANGNVW